MQQRHFSGQYKSKNTFPRTLAIYNNGHIFWKEEFLNSLFYLLEGLLWFLVVNFKQTYYTWLLSLGLIMFWRLGLRRTSCWRIFYEILAWSSASSRMYLNCVTEAIPWPRWHLQPWFTSCQAAYWGQRMSPDYHQSSLCLDILGFPRKESWQPRVSWHLTCY